VQAMSVSAALDFSSEMGSLISQAQLDKATEHVQDALPRIAVKLPALAVGI